MALNNVVSRRARNRRHARARRGHGAPGVVGYHRVMSDEASDITQWLNDWRAGDAVARDRVFHQLYARLRRLARGVLRGHDGHETVQATELLHDALLRLSESGAPAVRDREHFVAIAARAMRQILIDRARRKLSDKRGAGIKPLSLDDHDAAIDADPVELLALDDALDKLARVDARAATVVELRVFAGLTIDETAASLAITPSLVNHEWAHARAWLKDQMAPAD